MGRLLALLPTGRLRVQNRMRNQRDHLVQRFDERLKRRKRPRQQQRAGRARILLRFVHPHKENRSTARRKTRKKKKRTVPILLESPTKKIPSKKAEDLSLVSNLSRTRLKIEREGSDFVKTKIYGCVQSCLFHCRYPKFHHGATPYAASKSAGIS